ncbi:MAG: hypothetical protein K2L76_06775 [Muribaculaceae bacterium]|nr:hypothetical protein [Muribaculaceae bacterium]
MERKNLQASRAGMRHLPIIAFCVVLCCIICGCTSLSRSKTLKYYHSIAEKHISVYENIGLQYTSFLIIARDHTYDTSGTFEEYTPGWETTSGYWETFADTLILRPLVKVYCRQNKYFAVLRNDYKVMLDSVVRKYLIRETGLKEISDYSAYYKQLNDSFPGFGFENRKTPYDTTVVGYKLLHFKN